MLRASVVIATWERREPLEQLVEALVNQTMPPSEYEVIVCDSSSTDGTKEAIQILAIRYNNIRYINVALNNLAVKRNEGIRAANANIIILMDDDVLPDAQFVDCHVKAHEAGSGIVCCGQIRYPKAWTEQSNYFRFRDSRHLGPSRPDVSTSHVPPWMITAMNLSFNRIEILNQVGCVSDEFLRYGGEDVEFGFRIAASGIKLIYLPEALVIHYEFEGSIRKFYRKQYISSRDSAPVLYRLAPESLHSMKGSCLERIYEESGARAAALRLLARFCTHSLAVRFVIACLERIDKLHCLYFPFAYRYLTAIATLAGIRDRSHISERTKSDDTWF